MTIDENLKEQLINIYFFDDNECWIESEPDFEVSDCAHIEVSVNPEDARSLNEIESFIISRDVMGCKVTTFKRKNK